MNLLIVSLNAAPEVVGIGKYSGELASWLAARGHRVDMVCAPPHYPRWRIAEDHVGHRWRVELRDGVRYLRSPIWLRQGERVGASTRILLETSFSLSSLRWWLPILFQRAHYDIVYVVSPPVQSAVLPLVYRALRGVPYVLHVQDLQVDAAFDLGMLGARRGLVARTLFGIEALLLRNAARVTTIATAMARRVAEKGIDESEISITQNWADVDRVRPSTADASVRDALGARADDILFVYAGNMGEKQGLEVVLHAAWRLRGDPSIKFAFVGEGTSRARLELLADTLALENVRFTDLVPVDRLSALLAAADVHLVIQRREAADLVMPSKLTNIMASGRPTIATAAPGTELHTVLSATGAGETVEPDDAVALAEAVRSMARDQQRRRTAGAAARAFAEQHLDRDVVLMKIEGLLLRCARPSGSHDSSQSARSDGA